MDIIFIIFILLAYVCVYIYIYARWFRHRDDIAEQLRDRISTTAYRETAPVYIPACTRVCGFLGTPRICARLGGFHRARASNRCLDEPFRDAGISPYTWPLAWRARRPSFLTIAIVPDVGSGVSIQFRRCAPKRTGECPDRAS